MVDSHAKWELRRRFQCLWDPLRWKGLRIRWRSPLAQETLFDGTAKEHKEYALRAFPVGCEEGLFECFARDDFRGVPDAFVVRVTRWLDSELPTDPISECLWALCSRFLNLPPTDAELLDLLVLHLADDQPARGA